MPEYFIGETCKLIMKDITVDSCGSNLLHAKSSFEWLRKIFLSNVCWTQNLELCTICTTIEKKSKSIRSVSKVLKALYNYIRKHVMYNKIGFFCGLVHIY